MIASIDWVTLHQKFGFILVGIVLKIYLRLLLLAVGLQVVLGAALYLMGHRPAHELHYLYGAGMAVILGVTVALSRRTPWPLSKLPLVMGAIGAAGFGVLALISG